MKQISLFTSVALSLLVGACGGPINDSSEEGSVSLNGTLTKLSGVATEEECSNGGVTLDHGIDKNGDGKITTNELLESYVLCHGKNGVDGSDANTTELQTELAALKAKLAALELNFSTVARDMYTNYDEVDFDWANTRVPAYLTVELDPVASAAGYLTAETDPVASAAGYLTTETDPVAFVAGYLTTETDPVASAAGYLTTETDPVASAAGYLTTETDPVASAAGYLTTETDPTTAAKVVELESNVSILGRDMYTNFDDVDFDWVTVRTPAYLTTETDPVASVAGYLTTETDPVASVAGYLTTETDPVASAAGYLTAETDPVASAAGYLTAETDPVASAAGYLTTETDPVFLAHAAYTIGTDDITNWDTSHGWGDHTAAVAQNTAQIAAIDLTLFSCVTGYAGPGCIYSNAVTCTGHGTVANDGSCTCATGWQGESCSSEKIDNLITINGTGSIVSEQWYDGRTTDGLGSTISVSDYLNKGIAWKFAAAIDPTIEATTENSGKVYTYSISNGLRLSDGTVTHTLSDYSIKVYGDYSGMGMYVSITGPTAHGWISAGWFGPANAEISSTTSVHAALAIANAEATYREIKHQLGSGIWAAQSFTSSTKETFYLANIATNGTIASEQWYDGRTVDGLNNSISASDYLDKTANWTFVASINPDVTPTSHASYKEYEFDTVGGLRLSDGVVTHVLNSYSVIVSGDYSGMGMYLSISGETPDGWISASWYGAVNTEIDSASSVQEALTIAEGAATSRSVKHQLGSGIWAAHTLSSFQIVE